MEFIQLTQIQADAHSLTAIESEVVGIIAISKDLLRNAGIIMQNRELAPPKNLYQNTGYCYTTKIFFPCSGKDTTILVAEKLENILAALEK